MHTVRIPTTRWFECQMFLNHNYWYPIVDYRWRIVGLHCYIDFLKPITYEVFSQRFAAIIDPV